jgi:hypothetical protein
MSHFVNEAIWKYKKCGLNIEVLNHIALVK